MLDTCKPMLLCILVDVWMSDCNLHAFDLQGMFGIGDEVYLSLPCVLNSNGVSSVVNMTLTEDERAQLKKSADTLWNIQRDLKDL